MRNGNFVALLVMDINHKVLTIRIVNEKATMPTFTASVLVLNELTRRTLHMVINVLFLMTSKAKATKPTSE